MNNYFIVRVFLMNTCQIKIILDFSSQIQNMNALLKHLTTFISTSLQLYSPLPFEFTADLHTLNAYLRSYTESQQKLLEGFVDRIVQKLQRKMRNMVKRQKEQNVNTQFDYTLKHYNSCTIKNPDLKIQQLGENINHNELSINFLQFGQKQIGQILSQRGGKITEQLAIKPQRHKFGSRHRNKISNDSNKENYSFEVNLIQKKNENEEKQKILQFNHSVKEIIPNMINHVIRKKSTEAFQKDRKDQYFSRGKVRYESNEAKSSSNAASLKIKLKPKPSLDLFKIKEGISEVCSLFNQQQKEIMQLFTQIINIQEQEKDLNLSH